MADIKPGCRECGNKGLHEVCGYFCSRAQVSEEYNSLEELKNTIVDDKKDIVDCVKARVDEAVINSARIG